MILLQLFVRTADAVHIQHQVDVGHSLRDVSANYRVVQVLVDHQHLRRQVVLLHQTVEVVLHSVDFVTADLAGCRVGPPGRSHRILRIDRDMHAWIDQEPLDLAHLVDHVAPADLKIEDDLEIVAFRERDVRFHAPVVEIVEEEAIVSGACLGLRVDQIERRRDEAVSVQVVVDPGLLT